MGIFSFLFRHTEQDEFLKRFTGTLALLENTALDSFRRAADNGHAPSQFQLGNLYAQGDGAAQDFHKAVKWYRKAAEQGLAEAQYALSCHYFSGIGIAKNPIEGVNWSRRAAYQGVAAAQYNLAVCFEHGDGLMQDLEEAV
jgi:hypothetical protein